MVDNPFTFDRPLPPDQLIDRRAELEQLIALARSGQSVRLGAPRRFGKTTLLRALAETAWQAHDFIPAIVDLSGAVALSDVAVRIERAYEAGLERSRLRTAWRSIRRRGGSVNVSGIGGAVGVGVPSDAAVLHDALEFPVRVHERTGQRCLVIFDEVQDVLGAHDGLDGLLRSHLQHHAGVASYVFAGSQPTLLRALFEDRRRPLFEQARAVALGRIDPSEIAAWIDDHLVAAGREGLAEHADDLAAIAAGHPQRSMMLAHFLFEQQDGPDALVHALAAAITEARDGLEATWAALSASQRKLLAAVAAGHDRATSHDALALTGAGRGAQAKVRDQLVAQAHLERMADGRVRLIDPLLGRWLRPAA